MKRGIRKLAVFLAFCLISSAAWAQSCTFGITPLSFGQVDTLSGAPDTSSATMSINCSGIPLSRILICPNIGRGSGGASATARYMLNGTRQLNFQLYSDSALSKVWGSYTWPYPARPPGFAVTLGPLGSATESEVIYGAVAGGQQAATAGAYSSAFFGSHVEFHYHYTTSSDCSTLAGAVAQPSFNVTAGVAANCLVSTQAVDFGTAGVLSSSIDSTGQVSVTCTPGTTYSVALSYGQVNSSPRGMKMGNQVVYYDLFRDAARTSNWGITVGTNTVSGTGTGAAVGIPVYGRILPQPTPTPGTYTDTVVVTVAY